MGFNFRKSVKIGPARVNLSKSGVGYSVGAGGFRYTKSPKKGKSKKKEGCLGSVCMLVLACTAIGLAINYIEVIVFLLILIGIGLALFFGIKAYRMRKATQNQEVTAIEKSGSDISE